MIVVEGLSKSFKVATRTAGLRQAAKALFHREYKIVRALDGISFAIEPGEIVGYIGPNGAGKSTTIKVMSGILVPDSGTCSILGFTPWKDRKAYVKRIGVVFGQRSQLWWDVPVIDSYNLLRDIYNVPEAEYRANLNLLAETLDLGGLLETPVRQLSLGQRMRCEIAASLLHSPSILFLDEPTIGLDAVSKIAVRQFIHTINREKGVTVILTTHDMSDIEALAHRILMIGRGRLLYDGKVSSLRSRFGAHKRMTVDYRTPQDRPLDRPPAIPGASLISWTNERAVYRIDTERIRIADALGLLQDQVELLDVSIDAPPIEELIVDLYKECSVS